MGIVNIEINGKSYPASTDKTLLDNILDNGIFLPHLCHHKELESYGGCGLCLVEVEGIRKPLRACSTSVREGMKVTTSTPALEESRKATLSFILSDHGGDCKAPCFYECPTHQDVQGYVALIANGHEKEALELIKKDNPLPASIGRVCPHPCEKKCRRGLVDEPISICSLKRFAADEYNDYIPVCEKKNGKKVAVIGGGPAGLSCAYFLLLKGYEVEIFESEKKCGGMLRFGIPAYRLPKSVLDKEIENIEKMGAVIHTEVALGKDFTVAELKEKFDAVFVGIGAWKSSSLRCEGENTEGVLGGIDFLYDIANGKDGGVKGKKVAVIGGGNTAIDAVRTACRAGAESVTLVYRRTEKEMPAEPIEIKEAKEEGVIFKFLAAPLKVNEENGKVKSLTVQLMKEGEPDASGRRAPVPIEGATEELALDIIISAVGQSVVSKDVSELELTKKGTVAADEVNFMTSLEGVFAAGDVINKGPDIAVRAIAGGKNAARSIDAYLNGEKLTPELPWYCKNEHFDACILEDTVKEERQEAFTRAPVERAKDYNEVLSTFTKEEAQKEASRCLECGCNSVYDCQLLPLMRMYDSKSLILSGEMCKIKKDLSHPFIARDNTKCILCALCVRVCREVSGTENLGLFGRGFKTQPLAAFGEKLGDSNCISCMSCVSVCPTGALASKVPTPKNAVLPFEETTYTCELCAKKCKFTKRTVNGRTVKLTPEKLNQKCSLGMLLPVVKEQIGDAANENILSRVLGDMTYFEGETLDVKTLLK